jgi:signal transduction histidine kinase
MTTAAPSRLERIRDVEAAVRLFRWFAVAFAIVQIGILYAPPAGQAVPFPRWPVAGGFAVALVTLNLLSLRLSRSDDERLLRRAGLLQLAADTALVLAILVLYSFDLDSRLWPLFVLPVLEGAMREQMRGAVLTALTATGLIGWHNAFFWGDPLPNLVSGVAFQAGVLLAVALGAGALARSFEHARRLADDQARRLRDLVDLSRTVTEQRRTGDVLADVLDAATTLTGAQRGEVYVREEDSWVRRSSTEDAGVTLLERLLVASQQDDVIEVVEVETSGPRVLAIPVISGERAVGLLLLARADREARPFSGEDRGLLELLAANAAVALENARLAEAESRTIEELKALDAVKDEFVNILAHELRGPMSTLRGYADLLRKRWDRLSAEQRDEFLHVIARGADRLAKLVRDIQEVTEADRRALPMQTEAVDPGPLIEEVAQTEVGASPDHRLELDIADDVPHVRADPDRLTQVLVNLVSNAVKYSPDGGRVRIEARRVGSEVAISVTDDGMGIAPHLTSHLFQKFSRLPTPERMPGTGLGLYLSRMLVEAMEGTISVTSEEGRGSTFTVTLPVASPDDGTSADRADVRDVTGMDTDAPLPSAKE